MLALAVFAVLPLSSAAQSDREREARGEERVVHDIREVREIRGQEPAPPEANYVGGEILVKYRDRGSVERVRLARGESVEAALARFNKESDVEYAEPDYIAHAFLVPNDPFYQYQWHLDNVGTGGIHVEAAWDTSNGAGVTVAVIDTGVAYESYDETNTKRYYLAPDLADTAFTPGWDFVNNDAHPNDDNGHGTHVAGSVAQSTNNASGVAGVAYGASIMPIKVLDAGGSGTYSAIANGIIFAADHGAKVINLSLGGSSGSQTLENALAYAYGKGVTIVAAAGNNGTGSLSYPAAYNDYVIAVGATRYDEQKASYSNYGPGLDLMAPGGQMCTNDSWRCTTNDQNHDGYGDGVLQQTFSGATNNFGYYFYQGTSMASPHVAAVAALVISYGNAISPDDVRGALESSAKDLGASGWDSTYGYGLVNAPAALAYTAVLPPPPLENQPPVVSDIPDVSFVSGQSDSSIDLDAFVSDSNNTDSEIAWSVSGNPNISVSIDSNNVTTFSAPGWTGSETLTFTATDPGGLSDADSLIVTVSEVPAAPSALLLINMSTSGSRSWRAIADVAVSVNGAPLAGVTVRGAWGGVFDQQVTGTANGSGKLTFRSSYTRNSGAATFTVTEVSKNGIVYLLGGETSDAISK